MSRKQKIPAITPELKGAVMTYLVTTASRQLIEPVVRGYQTEILARHQFTMRPDFQDVIQRRRPIAPTDLIVLNPERTEYLTDEDFAVYLAEVAEQHKAHGFEVQADHCPLLIAQHEEMLASNDVITQAQYITGIDPNDFWNMKLRAELLKLVVDFVVTAADIKTADVLQHCAVED